MISNNKPTPIAIVMGVDIFDEADILKVYTTQSIIDGDTTHIVCEERATRDISSACVSLICNSLPMYLRHTKSLSQCNYLRTPLWHGSTFLKLEEGQSEYDKQCPKVAWGIVAYIVYHTATNAAPHPDCGNWLTLFKAYHDEAINIAHQSHPDWIAANEWCDKGAMASADAAIEESLIRKEESLIEKSLKHGVETLFGKGIVDAARRYIDWAKRTHLHHTHTNAPQCAETESMVSCSIEKDIEAERKIIAAITKVWNELIKTHPDWTGNKRKMYKAKQMIFPEIYKKFYKYDGASYTTKEISNTFPFLGCESVIRKLIKAIGKSK